MDAIPMVSSWPHLIGLMDPLVQLYTGIALDGWEAIFQAAAIARLIGMSTGTRSAIFSLLVYKVTNIREGWILTCSKLF